MSWQGSYFGRGGSVWQAWQQAFKELWRRHPRCAAMVLVSPHYGAAGSLRARAGHGTVLAGVCAAIAALSADFVYWKRGGRSLSGAEWSTLLPALRLPYLGALRDPREFILVVDEIIVSCYKTTAPHDRALIAREACLALLERSRKSSGSYQEELFARAASYAGTVRALLDQYAFPADEKRAPMPAGQRARLMRFIVRWHCQVAERDRAQYYLDEYWEHIIEAGPDQELKARSEFTKLGLVVP